MTRKIVSQHSPKDETGAYLKVAPAPVLSDAIKSYQANLDDILKRQMLTLDRVTKQLATKSLDNMTKDDIQSLASCIKITLELKQKEKELLEDLTDEELQELAEDDN